jgi:serine/threonine protein kinase/tetratricopeptide (TPR) repeat protein
LNDLFDELQQTFGSTYTVKRELRGGGMARVFVAHDETLGREVIVKVLPPELTYGFSAARFTREFKLVATLQEPHIVPVLTAGQTVGGLPFYTMPFVRGESLRVRIRRGRIPLDECMSILHDIARALAYAHKQGIVHRDIKPENILLSEGTAVVTDFGIAKAVQAAMTATPPEGGGGSAITLPGDTVGTPAYMSPEQAAADPTTDQRADIYAWGVIAYELISGKHPFAEKTSSPQALLTAQMSDTPPSITASNPAVPRPLADLVVSCLSKTAAMRPANGAALLAALDDPSTVPRPRMSVDRLRRREALAATLVLVLLLVGASLWRARAASARPPLIAVLPFETEGEGADSGFADGLRDAVTGKLARLTGLSVIDRKSVLSLAASPPTSAQQAGKSLGADYVLEASVRWAKGADGQPRVRVSPTLIRVSDGTTRWAGEPEIVSPADPFTIQASVATRVAEALDVVMAARERTTMARRATSDTGAFASVIRGKRIVEENRTASYWEYDKALRFFEAAYRRDPDYADALGLAGQTLAAMSYAGGAKLLDSASILAQRALDLDPTQVNAVATLAFRGFGRPGEALAILRQAVRDNPSSIELLSYEQRALVFVGDSAGAWEAVQRILPLAPASKSVLATCFRTALMLRRYSEAKDLVARERALDPAALGPIFDAATLAAKLGDRGGVGQAVLELQSRGGRLGASDGELMRNGDTWLQDELANGSLASFSPGSALDSVNFYAEKAELFLTRGDNARALGLADSAWRLEKRLADDPNQSNFVRRTQYEVLAWLAALRGDRPTALSMLRQAGESPSIATYPDGAEAVQLSCTRAAVYGFLREVDAMLPLAQRCFTKANGYPVAYLNDPEFARNRGDPRFRALVGKLANLRSDG